MIDYPKEKIERIKARYADAVEDVVVDKTDVPIFYVKKDKLVDFMGSIRTEDGLEYNFLSDLTASDDNPPMDIPDYGLGRVAGAGGSHRFTTVYQLFSLKFLDRIRIKVRLNEGEACPTMTVLWKSANWLEREVWDMYGIPFAGHPDLKRIMLDQRWVGHPQRKDYPIKRYQRFEGSSTLESLGLEEQPRQNPLEEVNDVSAASPLGQRPEISHPGARK
jgi:NADH-quinone oxidoreductase subunit C